MDQNHSLKSFTAFSEQVSNFTVVIWVIYCTAVSKDMPLWAAQSWCNALKVQPTKAEGKKDNQEVSFTVTIYIYSLM